MSRLLLRTPRLTASALGLTSYTSYSLLQSHRFPARLDSLSSPLSKNGNAPMIKKGGGLDSKTVSQISSGSIVGMYFLSLGLGLVMVLLHFEGQEEEGRNGNKGTRGEKAGDMQTRQREETRQKKKAGRDSHLKRNPQRTRTNSSFLTGLGAGLAVSTFSRSLALIIGLMVVGIQWASSHGLDIVPTDRIQRYIKHVNLRSLVEENVAFKVSFGTTFAMAAFMRF
ncbi:hypothetical protein BOTNAR_0003g00150 [Botryotinia narcissicola]|uniref:Uncharacterized protein n=1 Tax=Botryotinia narcissicola TaxID=278944 RepID=A0A4Z1JFK8_9HELO|nr:hypothetical protein BOTNAR_0003g00150 [Botryotinia narcissicola]